MTRHLRFVLVVVILLTAGCVGKSKYMRSAMPPAEGLSSSKAIVYFIRPSGYGGAIHFKIWDYYKSDYNLIGLKIAFLINFKIISPFLTKKLSSDNKLETKK